MQECDVVIVGCGPAGLSAAIFCGRANLKTVIIGLPEKSQVQIAMHIENYFGFPEGVDGPILIKKGIEQAEHFGVTIIKDEVVAATVQKKNEKNYFIIKSSGGQEFGCHALLIATGTPIKLSGIKGEDRFTGKGITYCVSCDGPLYKNKKIAVVGNGNHAAESALEALSYTSNVEIIGNANDFTFSSDYKKELEKNNIKLVPEKVKEFNGENFLKSIILWDGTEMIFDGVFMASGVVGALDFASNLGLEIKNSTLVVDDNNMTSLPGVFAAGNCEGRCRQIAKNVGDGCNAAINVIRYLRARELYFDYVHESKNTGSDFIGKIFSTGATVKKEKIRIGWFSFSCCEDSTIIFTEMLNDYYDKWKNILDIRYIRALKKNNDMKDLDIAFVEGSISNNKYEEELKEIRNNCKLLIAIGSCAIIGMPSGQRNEFDGDRKKEIYSIIEQFNYRKNVVPLHDIVKVDDVVPGCPMTEASFLSVLNKHVKEFGIDAQF